MAMERTNLHEAANVAHVEMPRIYPASRDLTASGYPELVQVHDREAGKTYLYTLHYGRAALLSDVCVLDYATGRMSVIPREAVPPDAPWLCGYGRDEED